VRGLYADYLDYAQAYKQFAATGNTAGTANLYKTWQAYLDHVVQTKPASAQVVRTVFGRLPRPVPNPAVDGLDTAA
jgi:hypothetical protein